MRGRLADRWPFLVTLPTIGVAVSDALVAVSARGNPIRITGVYRTPLPLRAGDSRRDALAAAAADARSQLRVPVGTAAVLALEPEAPTVDVTLANGWGRQPVPVRVDTDAVAGLDAAGLVVERFDVVPAAIARLACCSAGGPTDLVAAGWTITVTSQTLRASTTGADRPTGHRLASGVGSAGPDLGPVRLPDVVRRHLDFDLDAAAIGAALRGFGLTPDLLADPVALPERPIDSRSAS